MSPPVQTAPARVTVAVEDFQTVESRLASDTNFDMQAFRNSMSVVNRYGDQETVLQQVKRFFMDLDQISAGGTATRGFLVNFNSEEIASIAEVYRNMNEQELDFFKFRIIAIFANAYVSQERYSDALPEQLTPAFEGARADVARLAVTPTQAPWYMGVPVLSTVASWLGAGAVPVVEETVTIPLTLETAGGATVTISDSDAREALVTMGMPPSEVDALASAELTPEEHGYMYLVSELDYQMGLQASSGPLTPDKIRIAREAALDATAGFLLATYPGKSFHSQQEDGREVEVQLAGFTGDATRLVLASIALYAAGALADRFSRASYAFESATFTDLAGVMDRAVEARRARSSATAVEDAQVKLQTAETRASELEARVTRSEARLDTLRNVPAQRQAANQPEITRLEAELNGPAGHPEQGLRQQLETARTELATARTAIQTVQEAQRTGTRGIDTFIKTELPEALRQARAQGRSLPQVLENMGFTPEERQSILRGIEPWQIERINAMLAAERFSANFNPNATSGKFVIDPIPGSAFERVFMEPLRAIRGGGFGRGAAAFLAAPYRITAAGISELRARRGTGGIAWGAAGVAGMLWLGWEFEYLTGMTNYRSPILGHLLGLHEEEPQQAESGTTAPQAVELTENQLAVQRDARAFQAFVTGRSGQLPGMSTLLGRYSQSVLRSNSQNLEDPNVLDGINSPDMVEATNFLRNFNPKDSRGRPLVGEALQREFLRQYFVSMHFDRLMNVIDTYFDESARLPIYNVLFNALAEQRTNENPDPMKESELAMFEVLKAQPVFARLSPLLEMLNLIQTGRVEASGAGMVAAGAYLDMLLGSIDTRKEMMEDNNNVAPSIRDIAMEVARAHLKSSGYDDLVNQIDGAFTDVATRLNVYRAVVKQVHDRPGVSADTIWQDVVFNMLPADARRGAAGRLIGTGQTAIELSEEAQSVAIETARRYLPAEVITFIDGVLTTTEDRLLAYQHLVEFKRSPDHASASEAELRKEFLTWQLRDYQNSVPALSDYFNEINTETLEKALVLLIQIDRQVLSSVGGRRNTDAMCRALNDMLPSSSVVDEIFNVERMQAGRGYLSEEQAMFMYRLPLLVDAVLYTQANSSMNEGAGPTAEELSTHFIGEFQALYPRETVISTTNEADKLKMALSFLAWRENGGAVDTTKMERYAADRFYWPMRAPEFFTQSPDLVLAAMDSMHDNRTLTFPTLVSLPEEAQRVYWNAHPDRWETIWAGMSQRGFAAGRAWRTAHSFLRSGTGRRATLKEWPEPEAEETAE